MPDTRPPRPATNIVQCRWHSKSRVTRRDRLASSDIALRIQKLQQRQNPLAGRFLTARQAIRDHLTFDTSDAGNLRAATALLIAPQALDFLLFLQLDDRPIR